MAPLDNTGVHHIYSAARTGGSLEEQVLSGPQTFQVTNETETRRKQTHWFLKGVT